MTSDNQREEFDKKFLELVTVPYCYGPELSHADAAFIIWQARQPGIDRLREALEQIRLHKYQFVCFGQALDSEAQIVRCYREAETDAIIDEALSTTPDIAATASDEPQP